MRRRQRELAIALLATTLGCGAATTVPTADITSGDDVALTTRAPRRLSADQLARSLEVATGQPWIQFEAHADTLGRPDYLHTLTEGEQISVAFLRFAEDGARATCSAAVAAERELSDPAQRPILGAVALDQPDPAARRVNLRRLVLRFLGLSITSDDDPRLATLLPLLESPIAGRQGRAPMEALRWTAVCVALATRLDFLTY